MSWKMSNESPTRGHKFSYDNLSRLTAANYLENGSSNDHFNTAYTYDKQGNMTSLARKGNTGTATYGDIDVLTMTYAGNQLVKAEDAGSSVSLSASMDFKNNSNTTREYSYDANGNLIQDLNKGIDSITYNLLNLPQTLTISNPLGSATNSYTYAADGRKLKTVIGGKTTDYCGNVIYENGVLKQILVEGGYIEGGAYYFYLTDHLGNNRVVANASGAVVQTNHYYPFGMSFPEGAVSSSQPYKYNGKELDTDRGLNLYDYSARYIDPALGRFNTMDPLAEKYYSISPYAYCAGNPVRYVDLKGMDLFDMTGHFIPGGDNSNRVLVHTNNGNVPLSSLAMNSMYNRQTAANIAGYYGNQIGIHKPGNIGVSNEKEENSSSSQAFITGKDIYLNAKGGLNKLLDNKYNLMNSLFHEKDHKDLEQGEKEISNLTHSGVYLSQMGDKSFENTTSDFKNQTTGAFMVILSTAILKDGAQDSQIQGLVDKYNKLGTGYQISFERTGSSTSSYKLTLSNK